MRRQIGRQGRIGAGSRVNHFSCVLDSDVGSGVNIGALIAGTFIVEYLFAINGLGFELVTAVRQRDYLVVQGITLVVAVAYVVLQFVIDFIFTIVDPRVTRE